MNTLWSSRDPVDGAGPGEMPAETQTKEPPATATPAQTTINPSPETQAPPPKRPPLQRNQLSAPPPPPPADPAPPIPQQGDTTTADANDINTNHHANPTTSTNNPGPSPQQGQPQHQQPHHQQGSQSQPQPQDSLSLAQLRRIVADLPRVAEPVAYDYVYADTSPLPEEIDEWFMYNFWQWVRLNAANRAFHSAWARLFHPSTAAADAAGNGNLGDGVNWDDEGEEAAERRRVFVGRVLEGTKSGDRIARAEAVGALVYLVLGRWTETVQAAGVLRRDVLEGKARSAATEEQLEAMKEGVKVVAECGGLEVVWGVLRAGFEAFWSDEMPQNLQMAAEELIHLMTVMYMAIQEALGDPEGMADVRQRLLALDPGLLSFLLQAIVKLRWDETGILPHTQIFLLFWKSILLVFGGSKEIAETKEATSEMKGCDDKDAITASPLDYHVFRQEITSKYPAYIPPQPLLPLEADQNTIIPQLPNHPTRSSSASGTHLGPSAQGGGASILHQPVHIATPAPSPPPSPGVGGKGGKKQNYQTNQNFPFMYPPLDATSNSAGGKGGAGLQDLLVGRKWEGSDVPASILEAGELFSKRVRMSRATRQLWDEREEFLKFERGYEADEDIIDELDLSSLTLEEKEELGLNKPTDGRSRKPSVPIADYGPRGVDWHIKERLDAVEEFYREALPHLQSIVIVLLRQIVAMTSNLPTPAMAQGPPSARPAGGQQNPPNGVPKGDPSSPLDADVDELRSREIAAKAVSGSLILLLKWFKLSHVLKFEYMTQLLLDNSFLAMALKIFGLYDVQQVVESKTDRLEHSFFYFCGSRAGVIPSQHTVPNPTATEFEDVSEDDAAPPPIKRQRSPTNPSPSEHDGLSASQPADSSTTAANPATTDHPPTRPEVDELGYPINPLPAEPITDLSRRNFFSLINYLRIMQKICKHRAHRNLLMVNYKSAAILRKALKVPQHELRLYTLKLFKNQVPYTGRKWRQSNMRVITAVYLHCRPELRDEWLVGANVEDQVDEALPMEQALRSLTHWFNLRRYPDQMAASSGGEGQEMVRMAMREEQDFFLRELDKVDWSWFGEGGEDEGSGGDAGTGGVGEGWQQAGW
ncbi:N1221-domain-containing protein [Parathielavia appendiculata]|uniref:N1221-domain-containing protein n=1 Tax=Parathielavia appendiculata TaxID=2587402 RepID=A0AAN6U8H0_9PEZI|nr:N1221-domain-containing protein [Parathielavia appendiculata]